MTTDAKDQVAAAADSGEAADRSAFWEQLRHLTPARIGLATAGASLATTPLLDFRLAHAKARDAVAARLDMTALREALTPLGLPIIEAASAVSDHREYLLRPDLGRRLATADALARAAGPAACDLAIVLVDGLSPAALTRHGPPLLKEILPRLAAEGWRPGPLVIVRQGRVAIGDAIATTLRARAVLVMIGERPGLSVQDSLGLYVTWAPTETTTDADRNCISNIWQSGLSYDVAAFKLHGLLKQMFARRLSGVMLKDDAVTGAPGRPVDAIGRDDIGLNL